MAIPIDPWHYARPQLVRAYLAAFDLGLTTARGVFARRRMGKTEFLVQDLMPAAAAAGYLTAYVNLWDHRPDPAAALTGALTQAVRPTGAAGLLERVGTRIGKVKASGKVAGIAEAALEAEFGAAKQGGAASLAATLRAVDATDKRLLLVIDEAQVLAGADHADFTHALRAALDTRKARVKVLFAGSSETTLRRMFGRPAEPFYNWAPLEPFDLLDDQFVIELTRRANDLTRYPLPPEDALAAFRALGDTPEFFRRFLTRYLTHADQGAQAALAATRAQVFSDEGFAGQWAALLPADRGVLRLMADGVADLHGTSARIQLGKMLGLGRTAPMNTPQQALRRLQNANVVVRLDHGEYRFEDEAFADWVRALDP